MASKYRNPGRMEFTAEIRERDGGGAFDELKGKKKSSAGAKKKKDVI